MKFQTRTEGSTVVIDCPHRLNMVAAPQLRALLNDTVADGSAQIIVNLSNTTFVDSSGLGALVSGLKSARQAGGDLRLAEVPDQVSAVLRLTNLDRVLRTYSSLADASREW